MSIEERLRSGLREEADLAAPRIELQLDAVRQRRGRRRAVRWSGAGFAAAAAVAAVLGVTPLPDLVPGGEDVTPAGPRSLVGTYAVTVPRTAATVREGMAGRWTVTVSASGTLDLEPPASYERATSGATYTIDGGRLSTNALLDHPGCQTTPIGTFTWRVQGTTVRFRSVDDSCPARRILFAEQPWERTS